MDGHWRRKQRGRHQLSSGNVGLLSTAGGLLFTNDGQNFAAWDAKAGTPVWHTQIGALSAPAETFLLDGKQVILASAGTGLYMFQMLRWGNGLFAAGRRRRSRRRHRDTGCA